MNKENQPLPLKEKLITAVSIDYPAASEILVSFPDDWELIHQLWREYYQYYQPPELKMLI